jgi:hypothetical protein
VVDVLLTMLLASCFVSLFARKSGGGIRVTVCWYADVVGNLCMQLGAGLGRLQGLTCIRVRVITT